MDTIPFALTKGSAWAYILSRRELCFKRKWYKTLHKNV